MVAVITRLWETQSHVQAGVGSIGAIDSLINQGQGIGEVISETLVIEAKLLQEVATVIQDLLGMLYYLLLAFTLSGQVHKVW